MINLFFKSYSKKVAYSHWVYEKHFTPSENSAITTPKSYYLNPYITLYKFISFIRIASAIKVGTREQTACFEHAKCTSKFNINFGPITDFVAAIITFTYGTHAVTTKTIKTFTTHEFRHYTHTRAPTSRRFTNPTDQI